MTLKSALTSALLVLASVVSCNHANAAEPTDKIDKTAKPGGTISLTTGKTTGFPNNQRNVPAFVDWVNEPTWTVVIVRDWCTGRFVPVPVVTYNRRLVQVYYDRVTCRFFYLSVHGQPLPY